MNLSVELTVLAHSPFRIRGRRNGRPNAERDRLAGISSRFFVKHERISNEEFRLLWSAYLSSKLWLARKSLVFQRAKGLCEHCRAAPCEECHHLHYGHRFEEPLEDLLAVCSDCHKFFSRKGPDPAFNRETVSLETLNEKLDRLLEKHG